MKVAVLFSGGKDSCLAMQKAMQYHKIVCLVSIISKNKESYMFHTPNINITKMQAEAIGLPLIEQETEGEKEKELDDLKKAIERAKKEYGIEGVVTGAIRSVYQASRVQKICEELNIKCINPLWQKDQIEILNEIVEHKFEVIITQIAAEGLDESWLGRKINKSAIDDLKILNEKYSLNTAFEGGEAETLVLWCPFFKKKLRILKSEKEVQNKNVGMLNIQKIGFV
jgi:ABC transporter with metal-binding/Fe-S-binding domain ATP-binding protein